MLSYCTNYDALLPDVTVYMNCDTRLAVNLSMFELGEYDEFVFAIKNFFNFLLPFNNLLYEEKYLAMIRAETDEERDLIVKAIKTNKPLPDEIKNKGKKIKKEKAEKNKK